MQAEPVQAVPRIYFCGGLQDGTPSYTPYTESATPYFRSPPCLQKSRSALFVDHPRPHQCLTLPARARNEVRIWDFKIRCFFKQKKLNKKCILPLSHPSSSRIVVRHMSQCNQASVFLKLQLGNGIYLYVRPLQENWN